MGPHRGGRVRKGLILRDSRQDAFEAVVRRVLCRWQRSDLVLGRLGSHHIYASVFEEELERRKKKKKNKKARKRAEELDVVLSGIAVTVSSEVPARLVTT